MPAGIYYTNKTSKKHLSIRMNTMFNEPGKCKVITKHGFTSIEDAFLAYKELKEEEIKRVADYYQPYIPNVLYEALYTWEIKMNN